MDNNISGSVMTYAAGERLTTRGDDANAIYILLKGKIKCMTTYGTYYLGPGSTAGLTDCYYGMYIYNYFAEGRDRCKEIHSLFLFGYQQST